MTIKEIEAALEEGESLKAITQAYSEIANLKVKRIRSAVERNRLFFEEISRVYGIIKAVATKKKIALQKPKQKLCLILTSNYRFYGNINNALTEFFFGLNKEASQMDTMVLGKTGLELFKSSKLLPSFQEVVLKTDMPSSRELLDLVKVCAQYTQVLVFYPKFKSLLTQQATYADITASSLVTEKDSQDPKKQDFLQFIFEPELGKILNFFDSQIITLLLEGTFLESELSRTASRFISMDKAETEANKLIKQYQSLKAYAKRNQDNNTILENFASMAALRKET